MKRGSARPGPHGRLRGRGDGTSSTKETLEFRDVTWINFTRRAKDCNAGPSASRKLPKGVAGSRCASEALGYGWGISKLYQSVEIHLDANDKRQRGSGEGNRFTHKKIN